MDGTVISLHDGTQYKDIPIPTHVHTFAEGWTSNAIAHWHAATCEHKDVVSGFAEHTWGTGADASKCIFCGYEKVIPKPEKVVVDFNTDGGSFIVAQHIEKGSKATRPSNPTKEGYKFDNWYTDTSYSTPFDFTGVINNDTTVYAKWTPNGKEQYTITWKDYDGNDCCLLTGRIPPLPSAPDLSYHRVLAEQRSVFQCKMYFFS